MTIHEISRRYRIPMSVLHAYERWNLCPGTRDSSDGRQYDAQDVDRLSMLLTLYDIGFCDSEAEAYMHLLLVPDTTGARRLAMLNQKRCQLLEQIHGMDEKIEALDRLKREIEACPCRRKRKEDA